MWNQRSHWPLLGAAQKRSTIDRRVALWTNTSVVEAPRPLCVDGAKSRLRPLSVRFSALFVRLYLGSTQRWSCPQLTLSPAVVWWRLSPLYYARIKACPRDREVRRHRHDDAGVQRQRRSHCNDVRHLRNAIERERRVRQSSGTRTTHKCVPVCAAAARSSRRGGVGLLGLLELCALLRVFGALAR